MGRFAIIRKGLGFGVQTARKAGKEVSGFVRKTPPSVRGAGGAAVKGAGLGVAAAGAGLGLGLGVKYAGQGAGDAVGSIGRGAGEATASGGEGIGAAIDGVLDPDDSTSLPLGFIAAAAIGAVLLLKK